MGPDPEPGQISASVGKVCLLFKDPAIVAGGQVLVKCTFDSSSGDASILFPNSNPAAHSEPVLAGSDNNVVTTPLPIESEPVDITLPLTQRTDTTDQPKDKAGNDGDGATTGDTDAEQMAAAKTPTADAVVVDLGFSFQSVKFALTEDNMSKLGTTEMKIEVCMKGGGEGESAGGGGVTVIGSATVRIGDVLQGKNTWNSNLALGKYAPAAETPTDAIANSRKVVEGEDCELHCLVESLHSLVFTCISADLTNHSVHNKQSVHRPYCLLSQSEYAQQRGTQHELLILCSVQQILPSPGQFRINKRLILR